MKHSATREPNSIQKVVFFCGFVILLISISLGIKLFFLIKASTFEGNHRYTIEIKKSDREAKIISVDPDSKKLAVLYITGSKTLPKLDLLLGVPIDMRIQADTSPDKSISSDLSGLLYNIHANAYDVVRLLTVTKTITAKNTTSLNLSYPFTEETVDSQTADIFINSGIVEDNKTISLKNASNISGFGSQYERVIERSGGTVIAVTSSPSSVEQTTLSYYGDKSYTVRKLESLFHINGVQKEGKGLSDITLTLGKDQEETR